MSAPSLEKHFAPPSLDLPWEKDVIALRRDLHAHPELGYEEIRTAGLVAERLRALGLDVRTGVGGTGVVGLLRGGAPGPTVLVRADMDALPIFEENTWEWRSSAPGKMHACGHDGHVATGLTVARLLAGEVSSLTGDVLFMFQPAEEGLGGAKRMIDDGLLQSPRPDYALALHYFTTVDAGYVGISPGPVLAGTDRFTARIIGKGGHGALPHETVDPVLIAAHVTVALQSVVSRNVDPLKPAVVTVGKIEAGSTANIIANEAVMEATIRYFTGDIRELVTRRCREIVEKLPEVFGGRGEFRLERGYPPTVNNTAVTEMVRAAVTDAVGAEHVTDFEPMMAAEDMSFVLEEIPGCYFLVGGRNPEIGAIYPHHHPRFNFDEAALPLGVEAMLAAVRRLLAAGKS